jgi:hypothetical protein
MTATCTCSDQAQFMRELAFVYGKLLRLCAREGKPLDPPRKRSKLAGFGAAWEERATGRAIAASRSA